MNKLLYKVVIEDIEKENCTEEETEKLLDIVEKIIKRTAVSLARKAYFELEDFEFGRRNKIQNFSLILEKRIIKGQEQWCASFTANNKKLNAIATLNQV